MLAVQIATTAASSQVRRTRSVSIPTGTDPTATNTDMANGSNPTTRSETPKVLWMPSTA